LLAAMSSHTMKRSIHVNSAAQPSLEFFREMDTGQSAAEQTMERLVALEERPTTRAASEMCLHGGGCTAAVSSVHNNRFTVRAVHSAPPCSGRRVNISGSSRFALCK
jgi:hypothetical protein